MWKRLLQTNRLRGSNAYTTLGRRFSNQYHHRYRFSSDQRLRYSPFVFTLSLPVWLCMNNVEAEKSDLPQLRIGFIGGGQMATALSLGIIKAGILSNNSSIVISDPYQSQLNKITKSFKELNIDNISFETTTNNIQCIRDCDVVFIAVKPQYLPPVMKELNTYFTGKEIIVSMVTGTTLSSLQSELTKMPNQPVIRIMPNTPALVGCGAFSITKGIIY